MRYLVPCLLCTLASLAGAATAPAVAADPAAEAERPFPYPAVDGLNFRILGPAAFTGRVADVEGVAGDPATVWVGTASGGVWKSEDGGVTFQPVFDSQPVASIGDIALAPSNPRVVYVGSGESNVRSSVSAGNGVYKSADGGASWRHLGLDRSGHISRILVHPGDPDTLWVGALGPVFGHDGGGDGGDGGDETAERGVYKSDDGGASWRRVLEVAGHGVADLAMAPGNPELLFAGIWRFRRLPWTIESGSTEGGLFRSSDGGESWQKIDHGLPELIGRIGVKVAPSEPERVYVIAQSNDGILFRSDDSGLTFRQISDRTDLISRGFYYTDLRVDPTDPDRLYAVASQLQLSTDGGVGWRRISRKTHIDYHALWIDPTDPDRLWQGQDNGLAVSYDRGGSWWVPRTIPAGQFYQAYMDDTRPFPRVGGGTQDNGCWLGPSRTRSWPGAGADEWRMVSGGDGFSMLSHPEDPELFLSVAQGGYLFRTHLGSGVQGDASPQTRRNDGGAIGELPYRMGWNSPLIASPHDPARVYYAGNVVFRSDDFGLSWRVISPDLTTDDPAKQGSAGGPVWPENTNAESHCTIASLAESPLTEGELWAGSDDGLIHRSDDGGAGWTRVSTPDDLPAGSPVSHLEPSRHRVGTVYAAFDRHLLGDPSPYLYRSDDRGASWRPIAGGLPAGAWVWALREDPERAGLLFAGTELGLYASWDDGGSWHRLHLGELPTVAVHDLLLHPRTGDLLVATHGRGLWLLDDAAVLRHLDRLATDRPALLAPPPAVLHAGLRSAAAGQGEGSWIAPSPPHGALVTYHLPAELAAKLSGAEEEGAEEEGAEEEEEQGAGDEGEGSPAATEGDGGGGAPPPLRLEIRDDGGALLRTLEELPAAAGLNRTAWDLRVEPAAPRTEKGESFWYFGPAEGPEVPPGRYRARLVVELPGEEVWQREQPLTVTADPALGAAADSAAALGARYRFELRLRELISAINGGLRGLDSVAAQLAERRATAAALGRELPEGLSRQVADEIRRIGAMQDEELVRPDNRPTWSEPPRLLDRLLTLRDAVTYAVAAPSAAQRVHLAELDAATAAALARINQLFGAKLEAVNEQLAGAGLPSILRPAAVELERRPEE